MEQLPLRAQFNKRGELVLSPRVPGYNWDITSDNRDYGTSWILIEWPEGGGVEQVIGRYNTPLEAYKVAKELT